jgi:preprotein translocase subunit SecE|tara:strand:+ start:583 stop:708 length:126 start_codon:yes stop_codon:yes gene_type:complete
MIFVMDYIFGINIKLQDGEAAAPLWSGVLGFYYDVIAGAYK